MDGQIFKYMFAPVVLLSFIPFVNIFFGFVGGVLAALISYFGKKDFIRWTTTFTLTGILCAYIFLRYTATNQPFIRREVYLFAPLFALFGIVGSIIFKYRVKDTHWSWLLIFPFIGLIAAVFYQSLNIAIPLAILGSISGLLIWCFPTPRFRWMLLCTAAGCLLVWYLLLWSIYSISLTVFLSILGGVVGGSINWFIQRQEFKWMVALTVLGTLVGGLIEFMYIVEGITPIMTAAASGLAISLLIKSQRHREVLIFILLGGAFFCLVQLGWDAKQLFDRLI